MVLAVKGILLVMNILQYLMCHETSIQQVIKSLLLPDCDDHREVYLVITVAIIRAMTWSILRLLLLYTDLAYHTDRPHRDR